MCSFHRYKYLMQFMCDNAPEAAEEIRAVYIESMGRTISALFRAYHAQLMKLELQMANRHDLIAVEVWKYLVGFDRRIASNSRLKRPNRFFRVKVVLSPIRLQGYGVPVAICSLCNMPHAGSQSVRVASSISNLLVPGIVHRAQKPKPTRRS